jgi:hypothetical protein
VVQLSVLKPQSGSSLTVNPAKGFSAKILSWGIFEASVLPDFGRAKVVILVVRIRFKSQLLEVSNV